jgi:PIN domain nuclease of toxin-antitoxin system
LILLDTVAFLRLAQGESFKPEALSAINRAARAGALMLSAVSIWEFETLVRKTGKTGLSFGTDPKQWLAAALATIPARQIAFEFEDAVSMLRLPTGVHDDPADRMLLAMAIRRSLPIVTDDWKIVKLGRAGLIDVIRC